MAALKLMRSCGVGVATAVGIQTMTPVVMAEDGKEDTAAPVKSRMIRPSDLPIYEDPQEVLDFEYYGRERTGFEESISVVRKEVQGAVEATRTTRERAVHIYETGKAHSMATFDYVTDEDNIIPRAGAITIGGLAGLIIGARRKGGIVKKVLYTSTGIISAASLCYPRHAYQISQQVYANAKDYGTIGYNFVTGVKPHSKTPPAPAQPEKQSPVPSQPSETTPAPSQEPEGTEVRLSQLIPPDKLPRSIDSVTQQVSDVAQLGFRLKHTDEGHDADKTSASTDLTSADTGLTGPKKALVFDRVVEEKKKDKVLDNLSIFIDKERVKVMEAVTGISDKVSAVADVIEEKAADLGEIVVEVVGEDPTLVCKKVIVADKGIEGEEVTQIAGEAVGKIVGEEIKDVVGKMAEKVTEEVAYKVAEEVAVHVEEKVAGEVAEVAGEVAQVAGEVAEVAQTVDKVGEIVESGTSIAEEVLEVGIKAAKETPGIPESIVKKSEEVEKAVEVVEKVADTVTVVAEKVEGVAEELEEKAEGIKTQAEEVEKSKEKREEIFKEAVDYLEKELKEVTEAKFTDVSSSVKEGTETQPCISEASEKIPSEAKSDVKIETASVGSKEREGLFDKLISFFSKDKKQVTENPNDFLQEKANGSETAEKLQLEDKISTGEKPVEIQTEKNSSSESEKPLEVAEKIQPCESEKPLKVGEKIQTSEGEKPTEVVDNIQSLESEKQEGFSISEAARELAEEIQSPEDKKLDDSDSPDSIIDILEPVIEGLAKDVVVEIGEEVVEEAAKIIKDAAGDMKESLSDVIEVTDVVEMVGGKVVEVMDAVQDATSEAMKDEGVEQSLSSQAGIVKMVSEEVEKVTEGVMFIADKIEEVAEIVKDELGSIEEKATELVGSEEKREEFLEDLIENVTEGEILDTGEEIKGAVEEEGEILAGNKEGQIGAQESAQKLPEFSALPEPAPKISLFDRLVQIFSKDEEVKEFKTDIKSETVIKDSSEIMAQKPQTKSELSDTLTKSVAISDLKVEKEKHDEGGLIEKEGEEKVEKETQKESVEKIEEKLIEKAEEKEKENDTQKEAVEKKKGEELIGKGEEKFEKETEGEWELVQDLGAEKAEKLSNENKLVENVPQEIAQTLQPSTESTHPSLKPSELTKPGEKVGPIDRIISWFSKDDQVRSKIVEPSESTQIIGEKVLHSEAPKPAIISEHVHETLEPVLKSSDPISEASKSVIETSEVTKEEGEKEIAIEEKVKVQDKGVIEEGTSEEVGEMDKTLPALDTTEPASKHKDTQVQSASIFLPITDTPSVTPGENLEPVLEIKNRGLFDRLAEFISGKDSTEVVDIPTKLPESNTQLIETESITQQTVESKIVESQSPLLNKLAKIFPEKDRQDTPPIRSKEAGESDVKREEGEGFFVVKTEAGLRKDGDVQSVKQNNKDDSVKHSWLRSGAAAVKQEGKDVIVQMEKEPQVEKDYGQSNPEDSDMYTTRG